MIIFVKMKSFGKHLFKNLILQEKIMVCEHKKAPSTRGLRLFPARFYLTAKKHKKAPSTRGLRHALFTCISSIYRTQKSPINTGIETNNADTFLTSYKQHKKAPSTRGLRHKDDMASFQIFRQHKKAPSTRGLRLNTANNNS